jgi:hypothetical protein
MVFTCSGNVDDFVLSMNTEKRRKSATITSIAEKVQRDYTLPETIVLRWDEKKTNGKERCSVVLDGDERDPMHIGSPILPAGNAKVKSETVIGKFQDQGDTKWIVIMGHLKGHNDTPFGRPKPGRPFGRPVVGCSQGVFGGSSN